MEKSGKLFVYAATSIRFISDDFVGDPREHLGLLLDAPAAEGVGVTPYTRLDNLYMDVLRTYLSPSNPRYVLDRPQAVIGNVIVLREPLTLPSLAKLVKYDVVQINAALNRLHSMIIPPVR